MRRGESGCPYFKAILHLISTGPHKQAFSRQGYAQSIAIPLNSNIPVCSTFHFPDSPCEGLQAIYKLQVVFAMRTLKVYLSRGSSLAFCLLRWGWKRGRRAGRPELMNVYETIISVGRGRCRRGQSLQCLSPHYWKCFAAFPPIAQIHYLLLYRTSL